MYYWISVLRELLYKHLNVLNPFPSHFSNSDQRLAPLKWLKFQNNVEVHHMFMLFKSYTVETFKRVIINEFMQSVMALIYSTYCISKWARITNSMYICLVTSSLMQILFLFQTMNNIHNNGRICFLIQLLRQNLLI